MEATFFKTREDFRKWLSANYKNQNELWVGFYKVKSGKESITWSESVDEALCFGWIDGLRKTINAEAYKIRFTPRRADSIWSAVNLKKMKVLMEKGLVLEVGISIYNKRTIDKSSVYAFEQNPLQFDQVYEDQFRKNVKAWSFFEILAPSYKKNSIHWVMSAKQETTRQRRLSQLISFSEAGINQWKDNKYNKKKKS